MLHVGLDCSSGPDLTGIAVVQAAPAKTILAWLREAKAGQRFLYAEGADLPREAEAAELVLQLEEYGAVRPFCQRDPLDPGRWLFLIEKRPGPVAGTPAGAGSGHSRAGSSPPPAPRRVTRATLSRLMTLLRRAAERGDVCPSDAQLARTLKLRRRDQAQYLLRCLAREGRITVERHGRTDRRIVTIIASGRAEGLSTGSGEVR